MKWNMKERFLQKNDVIFASSKTRLTGNVGTGQSGGIVNDMAVNMIWHSGDYTGQRAQCHKEQQGNKCLVRLNADEI